MDELAVASQQLLRLSWGAALLLAPAPAHAQSQPEDSAVLARVDSIARQEAEARLLSGTILVARGNRVLLQRSYGFANWELQVPNGPATRFGIGSITKAMTEEVLDMLVREGRLDLDAPVSRYLGSFPKGPKGGVVTIRHLLDHRSGVPWRVTSASDETLSLKPSDIVDRVRVRGLLFEPGTKELYSSAGFSCLARVVEVLERKPFDAVLQDRIFKRASMTGATDETGQQLMLQRALPYRLGTDSGAVVVVSAPYKNLVFLTGAGSVYATAEDLLHFVRGLRDGVFGATGQSRVADSVGVTWRRFYGRINGYETSVDYHPALDLTFVFLSNLQSAANWQLRAQIGNLLLGRNVSAIFRPPAVASAFETPDSFVGDYGDPSDPIVISAADGHLFREENEFYPIEGGYYVLASGAVMRFRRTSSGKVDAMMTDWRQGRNTVALRLSRHR
jgi:CubicO group peptidase (beta-lactamase class C family)